MAWSQSQSEDIDHHLSTFDEEKMKAEVNRRKKKKLDITVVMQTGIEYQLEPNRGRLSFIIRWWTGGADIILVGIRM